MIFEGENLPGI